MTTVNKLSILLKDILHCLLTLVVLTCSVWAQGRGYTIQIASASAETEAQSMVRDLKSKGYDAYWIKADVAGKGTRYRVRVGRFGSQQDARITAERAASRGAFREFIITAYEAPAKSPSPAEVVSPPLPQATDQLTASTIDHPKKIVAPLREKNTEVSSASPIARESNSATMIEASDKHSKTPEDSEPKIASPPVAEALADSDFSNSRWKVVHRSSETDKNLQAIFFVDSMTGWAAGDAGAAYRTTDGGRSWKPLLSGAMADIYFIFFIDWNNGWMLGEMSGKGSNRDDDGERTMLFYTDNGGRTWNRKPMPNVTKLHFIDPKNGWAVGKNATVLRTTDGGENWSPVPDLDKLIGLPIESSNYNFGFNDIQFIDSEHGWMIGNFYGRARSNIGGIFVTLDGGKSWKRIPLTLQTQHSSGRFTPGLLHSIHFTDPNTGSLTGEMNDGEGRFFFVLHTRDAGKSWEQFRTPSRATHNTQFLDLSNGWTAAFAPREGAAEAVVYDTTLMRTDNGGMSWQKDYVARGRRIRSVFFLSPTKGWAVGDRGAILRYDEKNR